MSVPPFDLDYYRARIAALAERGIFVGTSSWKYEGWLGQIYAPSRYEYRGRVASRATLFQATNRLADGRVEQDKTARRNDEATATLCDGPAVCPANLTQGRVSELSDLSI